MNPFKQQLRQKIAELRFNEHQIYNAKETGLIRKLLPDRTYVSLAARHCPGNSKIKKYISGL